MTEQSKQNTIGVHSPQFICIKGVLNPNFRPFSFKLKKNYIF